MNSADEPHASIERLVGDVLSRQPLLRAPRSLQARVLDELARRAAPWWRKNFLHWPMPARVVFLLISCGFAKIALDAATWTVANLRSVLDLFPSHWLYIGVFAGAAMYVALFGLGAAAYRTLYK